MEHQSSSAYTLGREPCWSSIHMNLHNQDRSTMDLLYLRSWKFICLNLLYLVYPIEAGGEPFWSSNLMNLPYQDRSTMNLPQLRTWKTIIIIDHHETILHSDHSSSWTTFIKTDQPWTYSNLESRSSKLEIILIINPHEPTLSTQINHKPTLVEHNHHLNTLQVVIKPSDNPQWKSICLS